MKAPIFAYVQENNEAGEKCFVRAQIQEKENKYNNYVARFLMGTEDEGGYFLTSDTSEAAIDKIKSLFYLDDLLYIYKDNNISPIGFVGMVKENSQNVKYHTLNHYPEDSSIKDNKSRYGGLNVIGKESASVNSNFFVLNDAGLNTKGWLGNNIVTEYLFENYFLVGLPIKSSFYDVATARIKVYGKKENTETPLGTVSGSTNITSNTKSIVYARNNGNSSIITFHFDVFADVEIENDEGILKNSYTVDFKDTKEPLAQNLFTKVNDMVNKWNPNLPRVSCFTGKYFDELAEEKSKDISILEGHQFLGFIENIEKSRQNLNKRIYKGKKEGESVEYDDIVLKHYYNNAELGIDKPNPDINDYLLAPGYYVKSSSFEGPAIGERRWYGIKVDENHLISSVYRAPSPSKPTIYLNMLPEGGDQETLSNIYNVYWDYIGEVDVNKVKVIFKAIRGGATTSSSGDSTISFYKGDTNEPISEYINKEIPLGMDAANPIRIRVEYKREAPAIFYVVVDATMNMTNDYYFSNTTQDGSVIIENKYLNEQK